MANTSIRPQTCKFFDLPGELRNKIYDFYFEPEARTFSYLHAQIESPSDALLRTCKRINNEAAQLYHDGLKRALLQDKVIIHLSTKGSDGTVRHAGWSKVNQQRFEIWVRADKQSKDEIGWLIPITYLWCGENLAKRNKIPESVREREDEVLKLAALLEGWMERFSKEGEDSPVMRRLHCIHSRITSTVSRLRKEVSMARAAAQYLAFDAHLTGLVQSVMSTSETGSCLNSGNRFATRGH